MKERERETDRNRVRETEEVREEVIEMDIQRKKCNDKNNTIAGIRLLCYNCPRK